MSAARIKNTILFCCKQRFEPNILHFIHFEEHAYCFEKKLPMTYNDCTLFEASYRHNELRNQIMQMQLSSPCNMKYGKCKIDNLKVKAKLKSNIINNCLCFKKMYT